MPYYRKLKVLLLSALLTMYLILFGGCPEAAVAGAGLFSPLPEPEQSLDDYSDPALVLRRRFVNINLELIVPQVVGEDASGINDQTMVVFNLFPDLAITVAPIRARWSPNRLTLIWEGENDAPYGGMSTLAVTNGVAAGNVRTESGDLYEIRYAGGGIYVVKEIDVLSYPSELAPPTPILPEFQASDLGPAASDDGSIIDVMVVYTATARSAAGGSSALESLIQLGITETNQGYTNSGANQRINLVHTAEVDYSEAGFNWSTTLSRLRDTSDGYMDDVHAWRDAYGADLVSLWVNDTASCGIGYVMQSVTTAFAPYGFTVISRICATGYYSFAHEMGHNEGGAHDRANAGVLGAYAYSFGYQAPDEAFRTIMAYNCPGGCTRVNYWSNPDISYGGQPMGVIDTDPSAADNRQTLNNTALTTANFRLAVADLALTKVVDNVLPQLGDNVIFTITLSNNGPSDAAGVQVTDLLPDGLNFFDANMSTGNYDQWTGVWDVGSLADGNTADLTLTATVTKPGVITNNAAVTSLDQQDSTTASAAANINGGNNAPVADNQSVNTLLGKAVAIPLAATDADGNALTYLKVTDPAHGSVSLAGNLATYTPLAGYTGPDSFTWKANDGLFDSNTATADILVKAGNSAPVANDQTIITAAGQAVEIVLSVTDLDADDITCLIETNPAHGTLSVDGKTAAYTPSAEFSGVDGFTWKANDGLADSNTATVRIVVTSGGGGGGGCFFDSVTAE